MTEWCQWSCLHNIDDSAFHQLHLFGQLQLFLDRDSLTAVVHTLSTLRLDYCNVFYVGMPLGLVQKLQLVQKEAARLLMESSGWEHTIPTVKTPPLAAQLLLNEVQVTCIHLHSPEQLPVFVWGYKTRTLWWWSPNSGTLCPKSMNGNIVVGLPSLPALTDSRQRWIWCWQWQRESIFHLRVAGYLRVKAGCVEHTALFTTLLLLPAHRHFPPEAIATLSLMAGPALVPGICTLPYTSDVRGISKQSGPTILDLSFHRANRDYPCPKVCLQWEWITVEDVAVWKGSETRQAITDPILLKKCNQHFLNQPES